MTEETTGWLAESKRTRREFWTQLSLLKALRRTLCPRLPEGGGLEPRCQCSHYGLPQEGPPLDSRGQGLSGGLGPPMLGTAGHPCRLGAQPSLHTSRACLRGHWPTPQLCPAGERPSWPLRRDSDK